MSNVKVAASKLVKKLMDARVNEEQAHAQEILRADTAEEIYNIIKNFQREDPYNYRRTSKKLDWLCDLLDSGGITDEKFVVHVKGVVTSALSGP